MQKIIISVILTVFINLFICPFSFAKDVILEAGTKIRLNLVNDISSNVDKEGDEVNFIVVENVTADDTVIIKEGTRATGFISELESRGRMGKAGKIVVSLDITKAVNDKKIPLTATITKKGENKQIFSIALSICLNPLFLLFRGTDAKLPAGYKIDARVDRDILLSIDNSL
ncbi:MAG: hypothetical protein V2B14_01880 [bacterium]